MKIEIKREMDLTVSWSPERLITGSTHDNEIICLPEDHCFG